MSKRVKRFKATNMSVAEKLGKELLKLCVTDGYKREFLEHTFFPYKGEVKESGVTILAMQGSPIRGFVVITPLARMVRVFDSSFTELNRIDIDCSDYAVNSSPVMRKLGYCPKIKTSNPSFNRKFRYCNER